MIIEIMYIIMRWNGMIIEINLKKIKKYFMMTVTRFMM